MKWYLKALLVNIPLLVFGAMIHSQTYKPPMWSSFVIWMGGLWLIPFSIALIEDKYGNTTKH